MTETVASQLLRPVPNLHRKGRSVGGGPKKLVRLTEQQEDRPYELFKLMPQGPLIGAEIRGVDLREPVWPELFAELNRALLEWKVLFFRDQDITSEQQCAFARLWGQLEENDLVPTSSAPQVAIFAKDDRTPGVENVWHADLTCRECPPLGAVLRMHRIPPLGGDTMWSDAGAAYYNLPAQVKERIDGLIAEHDFGPMRAYNTPIEEMRRLQERYPAVQHPVVRIHPETGCRTLFVNAVYTTRLVGVPEGEGEELLQFLFRQIHTPEYQVRLRWQPHTVAFWDNRATQHYALSDYHPHPRIAERVAVQGDRPR